MIDQLIPAAIFFLAQHQDCVKLKFCDNSSLPASAWGAPSTHVEASAKRAATQARKATLIPAKVSQEGIFVG